jgi:CheY-like chemotaxis protein
MTQFAGQNLEAVLEATFRLVEADARDRVALDPAWGQLPRVRGTEAALTAVFEAIVRNAIEAILPGRPERERIRVTARAEPAFVEVLIADTGTGIDGSIAARVFDAAFTTKAGAAGLGLDRARSIVEALGGTIDFASRRAGGTTFHVRLPRAEPAVVRAADPRQHILVIDDDAALGRALGRLLAPRQVTLATSGRRGLELLATGTFDAVMCDLMMPEMTGMEVYERIKADFPAVLPRVVIMTGGAFAPGAKEFIASYEKQILAKPFTKADVLEALADVLPPESPRTRQPSPRPRRTRGLGSPPPSL